MCTRSTTGIRQPCAGIVSLPDSPTPQSKDPTAFEKFMGSRPIDVSGRNPGELQYDFLGLMWDRDKRIFLAGQESMKAPALTPEEVKAIEHALLFANVEPGFSDEKNYTIRALLARLSPKGE